MSSKYVSLTASSRQWLKQYMTLICGAL